MAEWRTIESAPKDGSPFHVGTRSGGILLEAWRWCDDCGDYRAIYSGTTRKGLAYFTANDALFWTPFPNPPSEWDQL